MKVSYNQLQTYFADKLPTPEKLAEAVTFHVFEIEGMEKVGDGATADTILDIKVLPDRAGYAKSIDGIAREISAICDLKRKPGMAAAPAPRLEKITVKVTDINEALGAHISADEMTAILAKMDIGVEKKGSANGDDANAELVLSIPADRTDLQDARDIPEEIGRIYGYDKITAILPRNKDFVPAIDKTFYYSERIRNILSGEGFSEIYGYSLAPKGDYEIEKSVATDKNYLRTNLADGMEKSLELNAKNADLLSLDEIKIFEIGKIFPASGEHLSLAIGIKNTKKKQEKEGDKLNKINEVLAASLGKSLEGFYAISANICEIDFDKYIAALPNPNSYSDLNLDRASSVEYKKFSLQPFIRRDIAVWVTVGVTEATVGDVIGKELQSNSAGLLIKIIGKKAFDTFTKDGKTSFAFGITFQSFDRTLTDVETNAIMDRVYTAVKAKGWEVR